MFQRRDLEISNPANIFNLLSPFLLSEPRSLRNPGLLRSQAVGHCATVWIDLVLEPNCVCFPTWIPSRGAILLEYLPNPLLMNCVTYTKGRIAKAIDGIQHVHLALVEHNDSYTKEHRNCPGDPERVIWIDLDVATTYPDSAYIGARERDWIKFETELVEDFGVVLVGAQALLMLDFPVANGFCRPTVRNKVSHRARSFTRMVSQCRHGRQKGRGDEERNEKSCIGFAQYAATSKYYELLPPTSRDTKPNWQQNGQPPRSPSRSLNWMGIQMVLYPDVRTAGRLHLRYIEKYTSRQELTLYPTYSHLQPPPMNSPTPAPR